MKKDKIILEDGRYLIYYSFAGRQCGNGLPADARPGTDSLVDQSTSGISQFQIPNSKSRDRPGGKKH